MKNLKIKMKLLIGFGSAYHVDPTYCSIHTHGS